MRYSLRHNQWNEIMKFLDAIINNIGAEIYDNRCGKTWDVGQAVCAEAYGADWMNDPTFQEWDQKDDTEPPEPYYYDCAKRMAEGYIPEWVERR